MPYRITGVYIRGGALPPGPGAAFGINVSGGRLSMDLELLKYFVVTAEMEHVTKAANELHITQPSLSSAMKRLENNLGLPLFEKDGRGIKLTDYAHAYYRKIKLALDIIDEANSEIAKVQQNLDRTLTVFAPSLFNFPGLMDVIMHDYPNTQISHVGLSYAKIIEGLKEQKLDFAICWTPHFDPALTYDVLVEQEIVVCVGPQNAYYDREEITLEELNALPFIGSRIGEAKMDHLSYIMSKHGISPSSISHATSARDELSVIESSSLASLQAVDISKKYARPSKIHNLRIKDIGPIYENLYLVYSPDNQRPLCRDVCRLIREHFEHYHQ